MKIAKDFRIYLLILLGYNITFTSGSLLDGLLDPPCGIPQLCNPRSSSPPPSNGLPLCALPPDDLTSGRPLHGTQIQSTQKPSWFNSTLASIGQAFALKNKFSITAGALSGLLAGFAIPDERDVLSFTSDSDTGTECLKRYIATGTQMYVWLDEILHTELNDIFFTSVANVRAMHLNVVSRINLTTTSPFNDPNKYANVTTDEVLWTAFAHDLNASSLSVRDYSTNYTQYDSSAVPINQFIQGLTLFGFGGYAVIDPESMLIHDATVEELTGWIHLWAIVGYVIGIDDDYNIMLQPDVATARNYFLELEHKYVIPGYFNIDKVVKVLVESILVAINAFMPVVRQRPIIYRLARDYFKIPAPALLALINSNWNDAGAEFGWDSTLSASTALPQERLALNAALDARVQTEIGQYFGSYVTNEDKAAHVYYPGLPS